MDEVQNVMDYVMVLDGLDPFQVGSKKKIRIHYTPRELCDTNTWSLCQVLIAPICLTISNYLLSLFSSSPIPDPTLILNPWSFGDRSGGVHWIPIAPWLCTTVSHGRNSTEQNQVRPSHNESLLEQSINRSRLPLFTLSLITSFVISSELWIWTLDSPRISKKHGIFSADYPSWRIRDQWEDDLKYNSYSTVNLVML